MNIVLFLLLFPLVSTKRYCTTWHTIKSGDTCWKIASEASISVQELEGLNSKKSCANLAVGDKMCLAVSEVKPRCGKKQTVKAGDTCYVIRSSLGLSEQEFTEMNEELDCNRLAVGNEICVSIGTDLDPDVNYYTTTLPTLPTTTRAKCLKKIHVKEGDTCYTIWTSQHLTEKQFMDMNEELNCGMLEIGNEVCVDGGLIDVENGNAPLPMIETPEICSEYATVTPGSSCYTISASYGLNLAELQTTYNCDALQVDDTICVSKKFSCQHRIEILNGDTCGFLENAFQTNNTEMEIANEGVKCDNLPIGRMMCVWSADDRKLPNMTCTEWKTITDDSSDCYSEAKKLSITIDLFKFLNPRVNCVNRQKILRGSRICIKSQSTKPCTYFQMVNQFQSCEDIMQRSQISMRKLLELNPTFRCDKMAKYEQICLGIGPFRQEQCISSRRVTPENDNCDKIMRPTGLSREQIEALNPEVNCWESFEWGTLICTASLGVDTKNAQNLVVTSLKDVSPELARKYDIYTSNPTEAAENDMNEQLVRDLQNPNVNSKLKELYKSDERIRKILDSQHPLPRQSYCDEIQKTTMGYNIKSCYCGNEELLIYCQVLVSNFMTEGEDFNEESQNVTTLRAFRSKRGVGCNFNHPFSGEDSLEYFTKIHGGCFGGGCSFPVGFLEISIDADICAPLISFGIDSLSYCTKDGNDCNQVDKGDAPGLKFLTERKVGGKFSLCAIGSKLVKILSKGGVSLCWDIVATDYYGFVGKLSISSDLNLIAFDLEGGAVMKVHGLAFPEICDRVDFECEDYCIWKNKNWENGKAYGFFNFRLLKVFGFEGIKIFSETFDAPKRVGCDAGKEAAVVIRNERTCRDDQDRDVERRCWSGDDMMNWEFLQLEWGFAFKPKPFGGTLFVCEFIDRHEQKIGFDVYGGKSKNKGKNTFYYAVRNDGIYFGTEKYKEDQLMGSWDNVCEEDKESEDDSSTADSAEPTGSSSVPAASCGKRIVGYYTGWGEREITENQLKKLTHVIFAFVAMYADGSVKFGPVSADDPGPQAGKKAERRFVDMKKKARAVNSGVRVLFAVGGWDNSQYFSSVAADSGKRRNFVDSVASFIEHHKIDGVDLDWEYPEMKGGDKQNHVTLIRELRERFNGMASRNNRKDPYLITLASAAGEWNLREGYDLKGILNYADFINVMTYDYYGAWESKWGAYTGTPAPLYFGSLKGFSGKLNADFSMKFYACNTKKPSQLTMGVPFYGRYWKNVLEPIDASDNMWRTAAPQNGKYEGGYVGWRNLEKEGWNKGSATWHKKTKTPYIMNNGARMFLGFENERSLKEKMDYATNRNLGGLMIWALDLDDDADTLLNLVSSAGLCSGGSGDKITYKCVPIDDVRWWTPENSDENRQGQCGKSAPLINGFYPVCDPDDPGFSCCGAAGYCGSEEEYCECKGCVNYRKDPDLIVKEPVKPSREIQWYTQDAPDGKRGRCGKDIEKINGKMPICNPDDDTKYCCSNGGYCGIGDEYCKCDGCVNYRTTNG